MHCQNCGSWQPEAAETCEGCGESFEEIDGSETGVDADESSSEDSEEYTPTGNTARLNIGEMVGGEEALLHSDAGPPDAGAEGSNTGGEGTVDSWNGDRSETAYGPEASSESASSGDETEFAKNERETRPNHDPSDFAAASEEPRRTLEPGHEASERRESKGADLGVVSRKPPTLELAESWTEKAEEFSAVELEAERTRVGRASSCASLRQDHFLADVHAVFERRGTSVFVRDVSRFNGVYRRVGEEALLHHRQRFRIGQQILRFHRFQPGRVSESDDRRFLSSPNSGYWARIDVMLGPFEHGVSHPIAGSKVEIGRDGADICFGDDPYISVHHLEIERAGEGQLIRDLDSVNGTFLQIRGEYRLRDGDLLLMGGNVLRFNASPESRESGEGA